MTTTDLPAPTTTTVAPAPVETIRATTDTTEPPEPTPEPGPEFTYLAEISRTGNNVPHITADDMGSPEFGYGYAIADWRPILLTPEVIAADPDLTTYLVSE